MRGPLAEACEHVRGDFGALVLGGRLERVGQVAHELARLGERRSCCGSRLQRAEVVVRAVDREQADPAREAVAALRIERAELVLVVREERQVELRVDLADVVLADTTTRSGASPS